MPDTTTFLNLHTNTAAQSPTFPVARANPKLTEEFLLSLEGIIDASVWTESDGLRAHVTLQSDVVWTEVAIQQHCLLGIGVHQTPRSILFLRAGTPPTHAAIRTMPGLAA